MIRTASNTITTNMLAQLNSLTTQVNQNEEELATGQVIQTASDNPTVAAQVAQVNQQIDTLNTYQSNATTATNNLQYSEGTLSSYQTVLQSINDLVVEAGNSSILTSSDKQAISAQLQQDLQQIAGFANTQSAQGDYIYGGFQTKTAPVVQDSTGRYQFVGDQGQQFTQVGSNTQVAMTISGEPVFMTIPASTGSWVTGAEASNTGNGTISQGAIADSATWSASAAANTSYTLTMNATPAQTFTVTNNSTGLPLAGLSNVAYSAGMNVTVAGLNFTLNGTPNAGDSFSIKPASTQDIFSTVSNLATALSSSTSQTNLQYVVGLAQGNIQNAITTASQAQAVVGSNLNVVTTQNTANTNLVNSNQQTLSSLNAVNYDQVITQVTQLNTAIQAAEGAYTKIESSNLFTFLNGNF